MFRPTKFRTVFPIFFCAFAVIIFTDIALRRMERFEELVAKGHGVNSPLADFLHQRYGPTLAVKQINEDLAFEIEPRRRIQLWFELKEAYRQLDDSKGLIETCRAWIKEYPNDPRTLNAYEELLVQVGKKHDQAAVKKYLQAWADALIGMGPEAKLSDILKWGEFAQSNPRLVDEKPLLEKIYADYAKHIPALGALASLEAIYRQEGKIKEADLLHERISGLVTRSSPLQLNQSRQTIAIFLLNHRWWEPLQDCLIEIFQTFPNSINFDDILKRLRADSGETMGAAKQIEYYRQTIERAAQKVEPARLKNNVPLGNMLGDYGMLLWNAGKYAEAAQVCKQLETVSPKTGTAYQLERLLWLHDPSTKIRLPHAELTTVAVAPIIDGAPTDMCWFGDDHKIGDLKGATGTPLGSAWATYDATNFYLLVTCRESDTAKLTRPASDNTPADVIETFFNLKKVYSNYYEIIANPHNSITTFEFTFIEQYVKAQNVEPHPWTPKITAIASTSSEGWSLEMKIPWKELGLSPQPGASFFFNTRWNRNEHGQQVVYSWSPSESTSHEVETFGVVLLR